MERRITLVAEHIPGRLNTVADAESHTIRDHWDWKLNPGIFSRIQQRFGPLQIDLFASRISTQLPRFFSWRPDSQVEATDAFLQSWEGRNYANPPWALIPRVLSQVRTQQADLILVAPVWKSQAWYPVLLSILREYPCLIPSQESTILQVQAIPPPIRGQEVQLAAWPISGNPAKVEAFQRKL